MSRIAGLLRLVTVLGCVCGVAEVSADSAVLLRDGTSVIGSATATLSSGKISTAGRSINPDGVLLWVTGNLPSVGSPHAIRLSDGQVMLGRLLAADARAVSMEIEPWGSTLQFPRTRVAELIWLRRPERVQVADRQPDAGQGILFRSDGPPVLSALESFNTQQVVIASKVGRFSLAIDRMERFVLSDAATATAATYEVGLTDGARLRGEVKWLDGKIELSVEGMDKLTLPQASLGYVRRLDGGLRWLRPSEPGAWAWTSDDMSLPEAPAWSGSFTVDDGQRVALIDSSHGGGELAMALALAPGATGQANLKVMDGTRTLASKVVASPQVEGWSVKVPAGAELCIAVEANAPTAVVVADPVLVTGGGG